MLHLQYIKHFEFVTLNPDVPADQSIEQAIERAFDRAIGMSIIRRFF